MRRPADAERIRRVLRQLGDAASRPARIYLTGAKIRRGHALDLDDARRMVTEGLVDRAELRRLFERIEPNLFRYPAVDPRAFRAAVERFLISVES